MVGRTFLLNLLPLVFIVGGSVADGKAISESEPLSKQNQTLTETLKKANRCIPSIVKKNYSFCSGFTVPADLINKLWQKDTTACKSAITAAGFKTTTANSEGWIDAASWNEFTKSTQTALTYHDEKVVAFKEDTPVNCLHEWIHVLQVTDAKDPLLAVPSRAKLVRTTEGLLEKEIAKIEKLEKAGKRKQAEASAGTLQPIITELKQVRDLSQTFDEVEAHFFIHQECKRRECSADEKETALVNLYNRKDLLPEPFKKEIVDSVQAMIGERRAKAVVKASADWKASDEKVTTAQVQSWLDLKDEALIENLQQQKIKVKTVTSSKPPPIVMGTPLESKVYKSLPKASAEELEVLEGSKLVVGEALGKFLCKQEGVNEDVIVLTQYASKNTLIHEALHALQKRNNDGYCDAVYKQTTVAADFKKGMLPREEHDAKILYYQSINALAEREVYEMMLKFPKQHSEIETLNNKEFFKHYSTWLNPAAIPEKK